MSDDAGAETSYSAEVSDVSESTFSYESAENDDLVERTEASSTKEQSKYSADLLNSEKAETDDELFDKSQTVQNVPETQETQETQEAANDVESERNPNTNEAIDNSDSASQESTESQRERTEISENSKYSKEVNDMISSKEELEVYQKAGLREENIDGRTCLVRENIEMDYINPKTGMSNREMMEKGRSPYDSKTGEKIELHHIGQEYDSPLAELTADSEHGKSYSALHTKESESWRSDEQKCNRYNNIDRPQHWKSRARER